MRQAQPIGDVAAFLLSAACLLHCLALPLLITLLPVLAGSFLDSEAFHFLLIFVVIPVSLFAITLGCKRHGQYKIMVLSVVGLVLLIAALLLEERIGESGEVILTILGSIAIGAGHIWNFRLSRQIASSQSEQPMVQS